MPWSPRWSLIVLSLAALSSAPLPADVLKIDGDAQVVQRADRPQRGMSAATVEHEFGTPQDKVGPVGEPPIIRWDYPEYSVFFEGEFVLHSVEHSERGADPISPQTP